MELFAPTQPEQPMKSFDREALVFKLKLNLTIPCFIFGGLLMGCTTVQHFNLIKTSVEEEKIVVDGAPAGSSEAKQVKVVIYKPEKLLQKLPAVIFLSGCDGSHLIVHDQLAKKLSERNVLVAEVQSIEVFGNQCMRAILRGDLRARHAYLAKDLLVGKGLASDTNTAIVGLSHGGWTVLESLLEAGTSELTEGLNAKQKFRAGVALYPYCPLMLGDKLQSPVLVLGGGKDDWTPFDMCRSVLESDRNATLHEYADASHAWDSPYGRRTRKTSFGSTTMWYSPEATEDSMKRSLDFLNMHLEVEN